MFRFRKKNVGIVAQRQRQRQRQQRRTEQQGMPILNPSREDDQGEVQNNVDAAGYFTPDEFEDDDENHGSSEKTLRDCPICLEKLSLPSGIAILNCGHSYHESCVKMLIAANSQKNCPVCSQERIMQGWIRLDSTLACLICKEKALESTPSKAMEIISPDKQVIHTECLRLLRHTEPFRVDENCSSYRLWGNKSIRIKNSHRIHCFEDITEDEHDLLFTQRTFADDVAYCTLELKQAVGPMDTQSPTKGNELAVIQSLRKLRVLASACGQTPESDELYDSSLREARLAVFLREGAVQRAVKVFLFSKDNNRLAILWRQSAEFLAEASFPSYQNSMLLVKTGVFQTMWLHPRATNSFLHSFVYQSFRRWGCLEDVEAPLVHAGTIELVVRLMTEHESDQEIQLRGVDFLQNCGSHYPNRVFSSGGIPILRRHATQVDPHRRVLKQRALSALETFGIRGPMIHDERIDFCRNLSEVYG